MGPPAGSNRVYVDVREAGAHKRYGINHGIGRYAREVVPRLTLDWLPFAGIVARATPLDVLNPRRMALPSDAVLYSPGFSTGFSRCRQLLTLHDLTHLAAPISPVPWTGRAYYDGFVRPAVRRTGHVLTVSDTSAHDLRGWLDDDRVTVHNAGIGCSEVFTPAGPAATLDRPYFLYVGNLKAHKNPRPMVEAMAAFGGHLLVAVVAAADVPAVRGLADRYGLGDRLVVRTGVSDADLAALLRGSAALLFPSRWEGAGLPVIEALCCGTKVVFCAAAASVAAICAGSQFAVADPDDAGEFGAQMAAALDAPFRPPAGLAEYRWDAVARRVEAVIGRVRQQADHPSPRS